MGVMHDVPTVRTMDPYAWKTPRAVSWTPFRCRASYSTEWNRKGQNLPASGTPFKGRRPLPSTCIKRRASFLSA